MSKEFESKLKYRLCPDVSDEDSKGYLIQNIYENQTKR